MTDEKKKYDDGTVAIDHGTVESAKFDVPVKKLDGTTYQAARIVYTDNRGNSREIKMAAKAMAQPFNAAITKQIRDLCEQFKIAFNNDEQLLLTYEKRYNAQSGYWNPVSITVGHNGRPGIQRDQSQQAAVGKPAGTYNNEDAQAGQVINIAVAVCQSRAGKHGFTMADVISVAESDIVPFYTQAKEQVKALLRSTGKPVSQPAEKSAAETQNKATADDMATDFAEDDIPF